MYRTPRMTDGRSIPTPDALNNKIIDYYGVNSNWEYRKLLQNQGLNIMKQNYDFALNQNSHFVNPAQQEGPYKSPYVFKSVHDFPDNMGNLQSQHLTSQSDQAKRIAPIVRPRK